MGIFAIDFGTSNTVVTRWNPVTQQAEVVALPECSTQVGGNPPLIPSLVYVEQGAIGAVVLGQGVRDRGLDQGTDPRCFRHYKRGIGASVPGFLPCIDGVAVSFEQVGEWFLQGIIRQLQTQEGVEDLILTVPVDSFEAYRHWLSQVCASLGINRVRLLDEPTAAALGYGVQGQEVFLVLDFGGGTLDFSLVQLTPPATGKPLGFLLQWGKKSLEQSNQRPETARVLAKVGDNLGGADVDNWLADHFHQTQGMPISALTMGLVERLKIQLSSQPEASVSYFNDETLASLTLELSREGLENLLRQRGWFRQLDSRLEQVLQQGRRQGVPPEAIDRVLLVGGTAQMPAIQSWIQGYFDPARICCDRPFTAVAEGALQVQQGLTLQDFLYHSYGIRYWNRRENRQDWHPLIAAGQPYPLPQPVELVLGASTEGQPSIELVLGELGDDSGVATEVFFEGDRLVTRQRATAAAVVQPLNAEEGSRTIARLDPPGVPGSDRVRLWFQVDGDRILRITVEDILTGDTLLTDYPVVELR